MQIVLSKIYDQVSVLVPLDISVAFDTVTAIRDVVGIEGTVQWWVGESFSNTKVS